MNQPVEWKVRGVFLRRSFGFSFFIIRSWPRRLRRWSSCCLDGWEVLLEVKEGRSFSVRHMMYV